MPDNIVSLKTFPFRFAPKNDTAENWANYNPILRKGEPGIVLNPIGLNWLKIGDGATHWNDLPFRQVAKGIDSIQKVDDFSTDKFDQFILTYSDGNGETYYFPKANIGANGNWYVGEEDTGVKAQGEEGKDGVGISNIVLQGKLTNESIYAVVLTDNTVKYISVYDGTDGFSPTINTSKIDNGVAIQLVDKNKTSIVELHNGKDGADGQDGMVRKITTSYSPSVQVLSNTMLVIGKLTGAITLSMSSPKPDYDNEWDFTIEQGDTAYPVSVYGFDNSYPINWGFGFAPTFSANTTTVCRIYNVGGTFCGEWVVV